MRKAMVVASIALFSFTAAAHHSKAKDKDDGDDSDGRDDCSSPKLPNGDSVRAWNENAIAIVRLKQLNDALAARTYAMMNVAIYDAVNGIQSRHGCDRRRGFALVPTDGAPANGDLVAAAAAAAHAVLTGLFPDQKPQLDLDLQSDISSLKGTGRIRAGLDWGALVGTEVLATRASDGASAPTESKTMPAGPGVFHTTWSGSQFRKLAPFAIGNPADYVGSGPPALDSVDYAAAFAEVKLLGNTLTTPGTEKKAIFQFWNLSTGTEQPAGIWLQGALNVTQARPLDLPAMARLFALMSMAMADTVAPTYQTKYQFFFWRPLTAIRNADTDGNPDTIADPSWNNRAGATGGSPENWSGHSTFSGAAAVVLASFFCQDQIPFSLSVNLPLPAGLVTRNYPSFSYAEQEAGRSRVFGGLHFEFSNQQGLVTGRAVAREVLKNKLLLESGPTHFGQCPL